MKTRVLHVLSHGRIGGQERALYQLFRAFEHDPDYEFAMAYGRDEGYYMDKIRTLSIRRIPLGSGSGFSLHFNRKLINTLREYSIHHFHDPSPSQILPSLLCGRRIIRLFTRRGGLIDYNRYGIKKALKFRINRFLYRHYFHGFSGNTQTALLYIKRYLKIGKEAHLLYNGIDFSLLAPQESREIVAIRLGLTAPCFKVGTACHLLKWKRVDLLIRAFARARIPLKKLLVFGRGEEEQRLRELAASLAVEKEVLFVGEVSHMPDFLQVLDCYVQASGPEESFGNAVVEAMYLGIPSVIMSDGGGMLEHVEHERTGWIAKDEADLASNLEYVWAHRQEAGAIASRASSHVQSKYSISNMVDSYKRFYRTALGECNPIAGK